MVLCLSGLFPVVNVHAQQIEWIRQLGTADDDLNYGVSTDLFGNVYITGSTEGSLSGPNAGGEDAYISKYDFSGNLLWTRQFGTADNDTGSGISVDFQGNVFVSGLTFGSLGGPNAGQYDAFVGRFDPAGNLQWIHQLGTIAFDASYGVSTDASGNVYISGSTWGGISGPNLGSDDAFLSKFDETGNLQWTRQLGTPSYDVSSGVTADSMGNVYISGSTGGSLGGPNAGLGDAYVSKYDALGNLQWTRQLGTSLSDASFDVSADSLGNVYISGITEGSLGGSNAGGNDAFVSKYNSSGALLWTRQLGTAFEDLALGVSVDSLGNAYITGHTRGSISGANTGEFDAFVIKFDGLGYLQWTRQFGGASTDQSLDVSVDSLGNVYVSGYTYGSLGGPSAGSFDAFVAKYSTIPEPGTLLLSALASVALLLPRVRRQTERTLIFTNPR